MSEEENAKKKVGAKKKKLAQPNLQTLHSFSRQKCELDGTLRSHNFAFF
jgi:hypothetical protein